MTDLQKDEFHYPDGPADVLNEICQTLDGCLKEYDILRTSEGLKCDKVVNLLPYITCLRNLHDFLAAQKYDLYERPGIGTFFDLSQENLGLEIELNGIRLMPLVLKGNVDWENPFLDDILVDCRRGIRRLDDQLTEFQKHPVSIILRKCLAHVIDRSVMFCKDRPMTAFMANGCQRAALRKTVEHENFLASLCEFFSYLEFYFSYEDEIINEGVGTYFAF